MLVGAAIILGVRSDRDLQVVGRYPLRFDAELAVAVLDGAGIESVLLGDTTPEGPVVGALSGYEVAVRSEIAEDAAALLNAARSSDAPRSAEIDALDRQFYMRRFADRPAWVRWGFYALIGSVAGPLLLAALIQLGWLTIGLFP